jgi:hypothetical protein
VKEYKTRFVDKSQSFAVPSSEEDSAVLCDGSELPEELERTSKHRPVCPSKEDVIDAGDEIVDIPDEDSVIIASSIK